MFPRPSTAEPSETIATLFRLIDILRASLGCFARYVEATPTPGVYQSEKSFLPRNFTRVFVSMRAPCFLKAARIFFDRWSILDTQCTIMALEDLFLMPRVF